MAPSKSPTASPTPPSSPPLSGQVDCRVAKCVALTFDDGPGPYTARLLDTLRTAGAHATFFMVGQNVHEYRDQVRRMALEGHELGNHSWSHPRLTRLSPEAVRSQVQRTQDAIRQASGGVTPALFRPPYGVTNERVGGAIAMPQIMWSVDTLDWRYRNTARDVRVGINTPMPGGIVLFHDIHPTTVQAIPKVLEGLKRRGYTFVTVSQLFDDRPLRPGGVYLKGLVPKPPLPPVSPAPGH